MNKSFSLYLDLMRFLAAFFVVLSHLVLMNIIQGDYAYFTPEIAREAVILFFVLSGYVIAYTTECKTPSLVEYFVAQATVGGFDKPHKYGFQAAKKHSISRASIKNTPMLLYILPLEKGLMNIHI